MCLGQVIMALVDVSNGKNRHICYRDSKLTFLLRVSVCKCIINVCFLTVRLCYVGGVETESSFPAVKVG